MNKILIANWKANPTTPEEALDLFDSYLSAISDFRDIRLVVCSPFLYLEELYKQLQATKNKPETISLGAQDLFWEKSGPYTGEISAEMLKEFAISHVLVGHSDRRYKMGESNEIINKKIKAALEAGITPVLLVGERNLGDDRRAVLEQQLAADLSGLSADQVTKILITYEPVWAISTQPGAKSDTPESALGAIGIIKNFLDSRLQFLASSFLYGGSVNKTNVVDFLKHPEISGAVVGGASLRKEEFTNILKQISLY